MSAWAALLSLLVTAIGLFFLWYQLKKLEQATWGDTHSKVCDHSLELLRFLAEKPETYDYFYKDKELAKDDANRVLVLYASEAMTNFFEVLVLLKDNLPRKQWEVWHKFICSRYESSPPVRDFIRDHQNWYSAEVKSIADQCDARIATKPGVTPAPS
jgi:hypothetical protein